ncbi:hypothetical protein MTR67_051813 [Solanum verrucosum]|uniref:RNase H type-1 domain-containing protein n=1 Tax=Solanum verrucosum TaxID=315347 RepID=A0AAF1A2F9_SOLVR|nr:hypothetical protein MTR67_051813 [Solanum verrucosum]
MFNKKMDHINSNNTISHSMEYHLGTYKLKINGTVKSRLGVGGIEGVFRDHTCQWILGFSDCTPKTTPAMAELQALRMGLKLGIEHNLVPLVVDSDSSNIINWIYHYYLPYTNLIVECRSLIQMLGMYTLMHTYRE